MSTEYHHPTEINKIRKVDVQTPYGSKLIWGYPLAPEDIECLGPQILTIGRYLEWLHLNLVKPQDETQAAQLKNTMINIVLENGFRNYGREEGFHCTRLVADEFHLYKKWGYRRLVRHNEYPGSVMYSAIVNIFRDVIYHGDVGRLLQMEEVIFHHFAGAMSFGEPKAYRKNIEAVRGYAAPHPALREGSIGKLPTLIRLIRRDLVKGDALKAK
jgi:hypothetical protein